MSLMSKLTTLSDEKNLEQNLKVVVTIHTARMRTTVIILKLTTLTKLLKNNSAIVKRGSLPFHRRILLLLLSTIKKDRT